MKILKAIFFFLFLPFFLLYYVFQWTRTEGAGKLPENVSDRIDAKLKKKEKELHEKSTDDLVTGYNDGAGSGS